MVLTELIAANPSAIGLIAKKNETDKTTPTPNVTYVIKENVLLASSYFCSPSFLETNAPPPLPNINPTQATSIMIGKIRFTPANALVPT